MKTTELSRGAYGDWLSEATFRKVLLTALVSGVPLVLLSALAGTLIGPAGSGVLLRDPVPYVRVLFALPLLMLIEPRVDGVLRSVLHSVADSPMLDAPARERFLESVSRFERTGRSGRSEFLLLVLAVLVVLVVASRRVLPLESTWFASEGALTFTGWWYFAGVVLPFEFVIFRWIQRYGAWCLLLARFARLPLRLNPIHPDHAGGLGLVGTGHMAFSFGFAVAASLVAALIGEEILAGAESLSSVRLDVAGFLLFAMLMLIAPLLLLTPALLRARFQGFLDQDRLASSLFGAFADKWVGERSADQAELLGDPDPSSLADYGYAFEVANTMSLLPVSVRRLGAAAALVLLPFAPLLLTEYSVSAIASRLLGVLG